MPTAISAANVSAVSTRKRYSRSRVRRDARGIKQMVKTTNPEIARRIRVFVSSLEGFISQGYFFLLGGNRSHERWSKEEQYAKVYELRDDLEQKGLLADTKYPR